MALPAPLSLVDIRREVFSRATVNTGGDRGARSTGIIDSCIRQATRMLELNAPWLVLNATVTVTLTDGVAAYDFPDTMDAGRIEEVRVREISTQKWLAMTPVPTQEQRNALLSSTLGRPLAWWYENPMLYVTPVPDTDTYDALRLSGFLRVVMPVAEEDVVAIDGEAVIQRAEIFARMRLGLMVPPTLEQAHFAYLRDLKAAQSEGAGFTLGGDTSMKCRPDLRGEIQLPTAAYDQAWQPPGYWGP